MMTTQSGEKCPSCGSCGMPMEKLADFGVRNPKSEYCSYCSDEEGKLAVTFEKVVEYYTNDFMKRRGINVTQARRLAEESVSKMPAWAPR